MLATANKTPERQPFATRKFRLVGDLQRRALLALVGNLPLDEAKPIEVVIREEVKPRSLDQNNLMWSGPLNDIAEQAWIDGKQFAAEVWHEYFKREFLPDQSVEDVSGLAKDGYCKYAIDPAGNRVLIGSTTQLTKRGFAEYLEHVYAFGASLGVMFSASRQEGN